jgi:HEAT repeat protein
MSTLSVFRPFMVFLVLVNRSLVSFATLFGVRTKDSQTRYAVLLGMYALIYFIAFLPIPVLPIVVLVVGYVGVLAIGRAWVVNEKERSLIAKKLKEGNPDKMPDLRWAALISALQLVILFPLIFRQAQEEFALYIVPERVRFWDWVAFTLDSYNMAFLSLLQVYGVHFDEIGYNSEWGRHLVTLSRLTFDFLLIQGLVRLVSIQETIRDAVAAVKKDSDLAVLLGKRAVKPLIRMLRSKDSKVREQIAEALGKLGSPLAVGPLLMLLNDEIIQVRHKAFEALGELRDPRSVTPLLSLLNNEKSDLRLMAAEALGKIGNVRALDPLVDLLENQDPLVRGQAALALGELGEGLGVQPLMALLERDPSQGVRINAATALGALGDTRAVESLLTLLDGEDRWMFSRLAQALGKIGDKRATKPLLRFLSHKDDWIRADAAVALGNLGDTRAVQPLIDILKDENVREPAVEALGNLGDQRAIEPLLSLETVLKPHLC